jgi:hypothetical protein
MMEETAHTQQELEAAAAYEAAVTQYLTEMQHLNEQMQKDQAEIDRLKAETREMLARLKAA